MNTLPELTPDMLEQIRNHGLDVSVVIDQLQRFQAGFPEIEIVRAATVGSGIIKTSEQEENHLIEHFKQAQAEGRIMKFVPASGAATRMFKPLQALLNSNDNMAAVFNGKDGDKPETSQIRFFFDNLEQFAFYEDLVEVLDREHFDLSALRQKGDYRTITLYILDNKGLGLASLPKALIPFHRYSDHKRTPLEEHLVEAACYTQSESGSIRIHFTISPEHKTAFEKLLSSVRRLYESEKIHFQVETSFQKPETDTIAADLDNQPFFDGSGQMVFRPGGHGALLANLQELKGDIVFIKNIDNVVPDRFKEPTYRYKKIIGGYLLMLQNHIFTYLKELDRGNTSPQFIDEVCRFIKSDLYLEIPEIMGPDEETRMAKWLFDRLNRPIRVCGIVKNEGEPGGGPFFVQHKDGSTSIQIVESAQVDSENQDQQTIFNSATHFNPTDLVCSLRDYQGKPFNLEPFRDPETGFISYKSYQGRKLKALELPGLWNGSMAHWNSVYVEVPSETFSPVKTVNDLLRDEHRNE